MRAGFSGLAALLLTGAASARTDGRVEARYSAAYGTCMKTGDAARGVTVGMMNCIGDEIERQDARLNQAYRMVMARLDRPGRARLRLSERAWIDRRDGDCRRAAAPDEGGSIAGITYSGCILRETVKRTMWLERYRR